MPNDTLVIFSGKSVDTVFQDGGTQSWNLNRANARQCDFVVLCRNTQAQWSEGDEAHGAAFLIGRIADVVPSTEDEKRWKILFSEYALITIPDCWPGTRNPVHYSSLSALGINLSEVEFQPMPEKGRAKESISSARSSSGLTIVDAKKGLAATFGVSPDAVEITIRG